MEHSLSQQAAEENSLVIQPRLAISRLIDFVRAHAAAVSAGALLTLMAVNLLSAIARKTITNDEIVHIPAGYYHLIGGAVVISHELPCTNCEMIIERGQFRVYVQK